MLDVGLKPFQSIPSPSKVYNRKEKVFLLCDESFRSLNYGHRQASIALWVHPFISLLMIARRLNCCYVSKPEHLKTLNIKSVASNSSKSELNGPPKWLFINVFSGHSNGLEW